MLWKRVRTVRVKLSDAEARLLTEMDTYGPDSPEYPTLLGHLERISNLRKNENPRKPTPDGVILVLGNLIGILIIVAYEQKNVITSKGLGFVLKSK